MRSQSIAQICSFPKPAKNAYQRLHMYESYFGLCDAPFPAAPRIDRYVQTTVMEVARNDLIRCLERGEGPGMVIGPAGTGKSLLCMLIQNHFWDRMHVVRLESGCLSTRRVMLQAILHGISLPYRGMDEGELRLQLVDFICSPDACPRGLLLVVDEAHTHPLRVLEELRLLSNLAREGVSRVRIMLAGDPVLEDRFSHRRLESFSQRLAVRCYLSRFNATETRYYIRSRLAACSGDVDAIFSEDAQQAVFKATDGVPRLINQLCDHALLLAYVGGHSQLDASGIEEAWSDLQQLPATLHSKADRSDDRDASIIEFGSLADELMPDENVSVPISVQRSGAGARSDEIFAEVDTELDDFRPAGVIGPKLEITIDSASNPFDEAFDDEAVIIDRCAQLQAELARADVFGPVEKTELEAEPAELGQDSEPDVVPSISSAPQIADEVRPVSAALTDYTAEASDDAAEDDESEQMEMKIPGEMDAEDDSLQDDFDPVHPEEAGEPQSITDSDYPIGRPRPKVRVISLSEEWENEDEDLIVLEDGINEYAPSMAGFDSEVSAAGTETLLYGRLFTKLRQI